jgi:hypothetical protein
MTKALSNHEIVTLAVYLLGGETTHVDTEDIAKKVNEIAPGRFTWRKFKDQVNLEIIRVYLSDAKKPEKGSYLSGSGSDGWLLTEKGLKFSKIRIRDLAAMDQSRKPLSVKEKQWLRAERTRILASEAFQKFQTEGLLAITRQEAETFFRVDAYVVGEQRERKLVRVLNAFGDDPELGNAVRELARKVRGG